MTADLVGHRASAETSPRFADPSLQSELATFLAHEAGLLDERQFHAWVEIVADGLFDFDAKYGGRADFRVPAVLDEVDAKALEEAAVTTYDALGCSGVARVDFFLTDTGPVLNEVNTAPGMTEHSQVPRMFAAAGLPYPDLLDELVRGAHW